MAQAESCSRSGGQPFALVWSPIPLISWLMPFIGHIGICSSTGCTFDFAGPFTVNEDRLLFGKPTRYLPLNPTQATKAARRPNTTRADDDAGELGLPTSNTAVTAAAQDMAEDGPLSSSSLAISAMAPTVLHGSVGSAAAGGAAAKAGRMGGQVAHIGMRLAHDSTGNGTGKGALPSSGPMGAASIASAASAIYSWDHRLTFAATTYRLLNYNIMTNNCHCFVAHFLNQIGYRGGGWDMVNLAALMFVQGRYTSLGGLIYTWVPWLLLVAVGGYFGRLVFLYAYLATCAPLMVWFLLYTWCCWRDLSF